MWWKIARALIRVNATLQALNFAIGNQRPGREFGSAHFAGEINKDHSMTISRHERIDAIF
jgi:hypothetical protein